MITEQQATAEFNKWLQSIDAYGLLDRETYWSAFLAGIDAALIEEGLLPRRNEKIGENELDNP